MSFNHDHWRDSERFNAARKMHLPVPKILVIYTGGTIGMMIKNNVYTSKAGFLEGALRKLIILNDPSTAFPESEKHDPEKKYLYLPTGTSTDCVAYYILEYNQLLDSSCMNVQHYCTIAKDIKENYNYFSGFIILHGTDTMAYTSSYLSFMLENLSKPVILTGSQIPLFETRSDARDNIIGALMLSGLFNIPEVALYFNGKLLRGNRSVKTDSQGFHAFESPNYEPIATIDYNINVKWDLVRRAPGPNHDFDIFTKMDSSVGLFRIFPGVSDKLRSFWKSNVKAIVLQTYGMGNVPINNFDLLEAIDEITSSGTMIVNITQCQKGYVDAIYEAGAVLPEKGVVCGKDMTIECALAKLAYVFGHDSWDNDYKQKIMVKSIRGELTSQLEAFPSTTESSTGCYQCCLRCAIKSGIQEELCNLLASGLDPNSSTCFHFNPLIDAILSKQETSIDILVKHGAQLDPDDTFVGMFICRAAKFDDVESLRCWKRAGSTLTEKDYAGNCAMNIALKNNSENAITYLYTVIQ